MNIETRGVRSGAEQNLIFAIVPGGNPGEFAKMLFKMKISGFVT